MTEALRSIRLGLVGDVIPLHRLGAASPAARTAAQAVFDALQRSDIALGNFEMPLTQRGAPLEKLLNIRAETDVAADLPEMGFDVLNLANNHTVDYGWDGLVDTMRAIESAGVQTLGAGATLAIASAPVHLDVGDRRVGILAWSALLPTGSAATPDRPGLSPLHVQAGYEVDPYYQMEEPGDPSCVRIRTRVRSADLSRAVADVARLRGQVDVLIATVHWGFGSGEDLAEYQRPLAEALIDAGADVVHGHHPHAVHAIGFHRGKPILYSLGTFIGQQVFIPASAAVQNLWAGMSPDGYLAQIDIETDGAIALRVRPTTMNAERLPEFATGEIYQRIAQRLQRLSQPHGADVCMQDGHLLVCPDEVSSSSTISPPPLTTATP